MFNIRRVAPENPGQAPPKIVFRIPPFCCEGAPAFRRGEESQLSFFHIKRNVVLLEI